MRQPDWPLLKGRQGRRVQAAASVDLLADLLTIWAADQDRAWNETLIENLTELRPEIYGNWEPKQLTSALEPHRIKVGQVGRRIDGKTINRRGPDRADIHAAITKRHQNQLRA